MVLKPPRGGHLHSTFRGAFPDSGGRFREGDNAGGWRRESRGYRTAASAASAGLPEPPVSARDSRGRHLPSPPARSAHWPRCEPPTSTTNPIGPRPWHRQRKPRRRAAIGRGADGGGGEGRCGAGEAQRWGWGRAQGAGRAALGSWGIGAGGRTAAGARWRVRRWA